MVDNADRRDRRAASPADAGNHVPADLCEFAIWSENSVGRPILHLYRHYCAYLDHQLAPYQISAAHVPLLGHLWAGGVGDTQNRIATELGVDKATVSRVVNALVKRGLVVQAVSQRDSRAFVVELTEAGEQLCAPVGAILRRWTDTLLGDQPSEDAAKLLQQLDSMIGKAADLLVDVGARRPSDVPVDPETSESFPAA